MSVVLAYKENGKVWLAADSQATRGGDKMLLTDPNNFKIWKPKCHDNLIMGGVGTLRDLNIVSTVDIWFDENETAGSSIQPTELTFARMVREIVPSLKAEIKNNDGHDKSAFFMAYKDKCFQIDTDGCVMELAFDGDWSAIGSGETVAEAAFSVLFDLDSMSTREKIIRSVGQSCEQDLGVNYPILIMNTNDMELEVFDGQTLFAGDKEIPFEEISEYDFNIEVLEEDVITVTLTSDTYNEFLDWVASKSVDENEDEDLPSKPELTD